MPLRFLVRLVLLGFIQIVGDLDVRSTKFTAYCFPVAKQLLIANWIFTSLH